MSGGYFDHQQYQLRYIIDEIEQAVIVNDSEELDEWGCPQSHNLSPETILEFKKGMEYLNLALIYTQRIDWLLSSDDSEKSFHERLKKELESYEKTKNENHTS